MKRATDDISKESGVKKEDIDLFYKNIQILNEVGQQITSTHDFETIFVRLRESVNRMMDAECFGIRIYHPEKNEVEIKYEYDKDIRSESFSFSMDNDNNFSVWCIKNKKEIFINDNLVEHKKYVKEIVVLNGEMTQSLIFFPMILNDKVIGVLTVQSYKKNQYTQHHLNIIRTISSYAAIALQNAGLYEDMEAEVNKRMLEVTLQKEELEKSLRSVKLLSEIGQQITAMLSVEAIIEKVYESMNHLMDASVFAIGTFNKQENRLDFLGVMEKGEKLPFFYISLEDSNRPAIWCYKNQKEFIINDFARDYHLYFPNDTLPKPAEGEQPESLIYIPLIVQDKKIGVISIQSFKKNAYTEFHLSVVRNLALFTAIALEKALLYQELIEKNKDITDSINYAKKIQNTILPSEKTMKEIIPESFVLYLPKDIVSGDFYWINQVANSEKIVVAAVDCTGHGVSGAFLTIVGNNLLNHIVNEKGITNPKDIIKEMNEGIIHRLSLIEGSHNVRDGMDMSICTIDKSNNTFSLLFAGAYNPLYLIQNGKLMELDALRYNIGSIPKEESEKINCYNLELKKGDTLYLFSDGYADQLNHTTGKKFMKGRFKQLLLDICEKPMNKQKQILENIHAEWKRELFQTDDVLVLGFRI